MAAARIFARKLSTTSSSSSSCSLKKVTVYGSGLMGAGIVQVTAANNFQVTMVDVSQEALGKGKDRIAASLSKVAPKMFPNEPERAKQYVQVALDNIALETNVEKGAGQADLVIEAIPEHLSLKHKLFGAIDKVAPGHTLFASNTSSLKIENIAKVTQRLDKFGGLHFFNPVPLMKLVEVVRTPQLSDSSFQHLKAFGEAIGKKTVSCKDTPGFIVNRLLIPYLLEAVRMVERGDATPRDVDTAMKLGAGYPMGPFELLDYVGLDTVSFVSQGWEKDYPDEASFKKVETVEKLVAEKKFGMKTKEGFYKYSK